jgi:thiamine transport system substrate-binding protein
MEKKSHMYALLAASLVLILLAAACTPAVAPAPSQESPVTLNVMTHDSFAASQPVIDSFQQQNNVKLNFIKSGDAGQLVNKAILAKNAPLADVLYGVDNTFLSRALTAGIFVPYASPLLQDIPSEFKLDPTNQALPVDYGDVCINYDKAYFKDKNLQPPSTLEDLAKPDYKGLLVTENPAISSPGLAFMLATVVHFGDPGFVNYWQELKNNGLVVVNDWETAYYTNFSGSSGKGPQPMVVSYNSSPAAEVVFSQTPLSEAPDASITGPGTCFRQVEFVGILKGTQHLALAQKFLDFMLGVKFQEDMPLQMFVYPTNPNASLPDAFVKYSPVPAQPAEMPPAQIAANRDQWIQEWQNTVLK